VDSAGVFGCGYGCRCVVGGAAVPGGSTRLSSSVRGLRCAGLLGIYFHYQSNVEFERELHPNSSGFELVTESLGGAMPTLAPGAMIMLGMLGMLIALQHPAAGSDSAVDD